MLAISSGSFGTSENQAPQIRMLGQQVNARICSLLLTWRQIGILLKPLQNKVF